MFDRYFQLYTSLTGDFLFFLSFFIFAGNVPTKTFIFFSKMCLLPHLNVCLVFCCLLISNFATSCHSESWFCLSHYVNLSFTFFSSHMIGRYFSMPVVLTFLKDSLQNFNIIIISHIEVNLCLASFCKQNLELRQHC